MMQKFIVTGLMIVLGMFLVACGGNDPATPEVAIVSTTEAEAETPTDEPEPTEELVEPEPTEEMVEPEPTEEMVEPTAELTTLIAPEPTAVASGITPQEAVITANVEAADAEAGERLYTETLIPQCTTCHLADNSTRAVGPSLINLREVAGTRVEGQDAFTYAYNSIRYANDHVVDGYAANVMPVYDGILTDQEVYELIAYIWTLGE